MSPESVFIEKAPPDHSDVVADVVQMLVKQVLDLREMLSFYEQEVFVDPEPEAEEAAAPSVSKEIVLPMPMWWCLATAPPERLNRNHDADDRNETEEPIEE